MKRLITLSVLSFLLVSLPGGVYGQRMKEVPLILLTSLSIWGGTRLALVLSVMLNGWDGVKKDFKDRY